MRPLQKEVGVQYSRGSFVWEQGWTAIATKKNFGVVGEASCASLHSASAAFRRSNYDEPRKDSTENLKLNLTLNTEILKKVSSTLLALLKRDFFHPSLLGIIVKLNSHLLGGVEIASLVGSLHISA
jgi:hypothetical protein